MLSKSSSCFSSHNFLLNEKGDLYSFGTNTCGQLSTGDKKDRNNATFVLNNPKIKSMSTGHSHSFFLQLDGELYACGKNNHNQLGLDLNQDHPSFELVTTNVKRVDCSHHFSIIQKENGKIFWSGFWKSLKTSSAKFKKELEIQDVIHFSVGQDHALFLTRSGEVWSVGDCGLGEEAAVEPQLLLVDEKIFGLACSQHSFILTRDDNNKTMLRSFGDNTHGKLGIGFSDFANKNQIVTLTSFKRIKSVHVGADHSIILNEDGSVFGCGSNEKHMLGISEKKSSVYHFTKIPLANVTHVSTGLKHSMFVNENKEVYITRYMKNTKPFKKIDFVDLKLSETFEIYEWRKEIHKFFDQDFRSSVFFFLLCLKFKEQSFKITKWLKLNIIKLTY